jgi:hypothetical protein
LARGVTNNPALEAWRARAVQPCLLPSGQWIKARVPDAEELIRNDLLPSDLIELAMQGGDTDEMSTEDLVKFVSLYRELSAHVVVAIRGAGEDDWQPVTLTAADLDGLHPDDVNALRLIAQRRMTIAEVSGRSEALLSLIEPAEAAAIAEREAGATVDGYRDFRDDGPGAEPGTDGADVRPEPIGDVPRPRRSRAGRSRG